MSNCKALTSKREKCHYLYGKLGEDCLIEELEEKRCVAFQHCARQAQAYYGTLNGKKALCGSWAEAFCFGRELLIEDDLRDHHVRAQETVNNNKKLKAECRSITLELAKCMSRYYWEVPNLIMETRCYWRFFYVLFWVEIYNTFSIEQTWELEPFAYDDVYIDRNDDPK